MAPSGKSPADFNAMIEAVATRQDREAFKALFAHFAPRITAQARRYGLSPERADEVAQEAMLAVWSKAGSFDRSLASASTWIFTIARNARIDHFRREGRLVYNGIDASGEIDPSDDPERLLLADDRDRDVRAALDALTEEQRAIVRLSFFEENSHGVIAQRLGIPLGTVKSRIRLALARLRGLVEASQ